MAGFPKKTENRAPIAGAGRFDTICTAVCDRCDRSTACMLCRLEPCVVIMVTIMVAIIGVIIVAIIIAIIVALLPSLLRCHHWCLNWFQHWCNHCCHNYCHHFCHHFCYYCCHRWCHVVFVNDPHLHACLEVSFPTLK